MTSEFEKLAIRYKRFPTPEEVNYGQRGHTEICRNCRHSHGRDSKKRYPMFLWCRRLYDPDRVDNLTNPDRPLNEQAGMWTVFDHGCDVWKTRYKW